MMKCVQKVFNGRKNILNLNILTGTVDLEMVSLMALYGAKT